MAVLHQENLAKSAENHRLRRNIKKVAQELSDLQQEKERLEKDLQAAHREKSRGDGTIHVSARFPPGAAGSAVGWGCYAGSGFREIHCRKLGKSEKRKEENTLVI